MMGLSLRVYVGLSLLVTMCSGRNYFTDIFSLLAQEQFQFDDFRLDSYFSPNDPCKQDLLDLFPGGLTNISTITPLGWRYLDAWGKPPAGILLKPLSVDMTGSYEECQSLGSSAHYCLAQGVNFTQTFDGLAYVPFVSWGLCLPASCGNELVQSFLNNLTRQYLPKVISRIEVHCAGSSDWTLLSYLALAACCSVAALVFIGTVIEFIVDSPPAQLHPSHVQMEFDENTILRGHRDGAESVPLLATAAHIERQHSRSRHGSIDFLRAFSLRKNLSKLFNMSTRKQGISCFEGMRTISMLWVILGHTFLWTLKQQPTNLGVLLGLGEDVSFQFVINTQFAVDTFFFIRFDDYCLLLHRFVSIAGHSFVSIAGHKT